VDMMLKTLTMPELVDWIAYFSKENVSRETEQTPEQIQANLKISLAATNKPKKGRKK
jgi:hypothetical protein